MKQELIRDELRKDARRRKRAEKQKLKSREIQQTLRVLDAVKTKESK